MKCLRCGNEDPAYFYKGSKGWYCRRCVRFSRVLLEEEPENFDYGLNSEANEYGFAYELTAFQQEASHKCLEGLKHSDILLQAICGAGKTEIVVESIADQLGKNKKVAYAIARKEVVIELSHRFARIFPKAVVTAVYGGHHEVLYGDLIVCTCHQLYRYYQTFDLLIIDEADAYPLKGNQTLMNIALNACKGRIIFSTATVDDNLSKVLKQRPCQRIELNVRPSGVPLSIPKILYLPKVLSFIALYRIMSHTARQGIIFTASKKECFRLYRFFRRFFDCTYVYADLESRKENIAAFRCGSKRFIFATTVLERGITIPDLEMVTIIDRNDLFDEANLVQMLGRVGRGLSREAGKTFIIADRNRKQIRQTLAYLQKANSAYAMPVL